jgi:hypothetical protein
MGAEPYRFNLSGGKAARDEFETKVLNRDGSQVKAHWSKLVFTGKGTPPVELGDAAAVKAAVARNPNAISDSDSSSVDGCVRVVARL